MAPRSFWVILIKLIGVWILFSSITVVPQFITSFFPAYMSARMFDNWEVLLISLITILIYVWVIRVLVFKPEIVIDKLKLDKGFDEERLDLKIHRSTVVTIAIIIIGGLMIIESVPLFFRQLFLYYQYKTESQTGNPVSLTWIFVELCKILIGYLLVANNRVVVNFIEKTRRAPEAVAEEEQNVIEATDTEENQ